MKKIWTKAQCHELAGLPPPVHAKIEETVAILNFYYGENRDVDKNLGGYVLLIESEADFERLKAIFHNEIENLAAEYVDIIPYKNTSAYVCAQIILHCFYVAAILETGDGVRMAQIMEAGRIKANT